MSEQNSELNSYNEKLKQKITSQAKRLTKLASEKEELLELLKEKTTMTIDTSFSSCLMSTNKKNKTHYETELDKFKRELQSKNEQILGLEKAKTDLSNFKETISQRLTIANNDIDKAKGLLASMTKEKEELLEKIKQKELIISTLNTEKNTLVSQLSELEKNNSNIQRRNVELNIKIANFQVEVTNNKHVISSLDEKNKKMFMDNKEMSIKLKSALDENEALKSENKSLRSSNEKFSQRIDTLTNNLCGFREDISKTLKQSVNIEIENKKKEFLTILSSKDFEIKKLKQLNENYILLEKELSLSIQDKKKFISNLKKQQDSKEDIINTLQAENEMLKKENSKINEEVIEIRKELSDLKYDRGETITKLQASNNLKNTQINSLNNYIKILEEKAVCIGKNKKYLEHLLSYTHPKPNEVKQILEIYNEIVELEIQKKEFEKEYLGTGEATETEKLKQRALENVEEQIKMLKVNLHKMEDDIKNGTKEYYD